MIFGTTFDSFGIPQPLIMEEVKSYDAILQFPVSILGKSIRSDEHIPYHITISWAEWKASPHLLIDEMDAAIAGINTEPPVIRKWWPHAFKNDKTTHVLRLAATPSMIQLQEAANQVLPSHYPTFLPHITVEKSLWEKIEQEKLGPGDVRLHVHPLELRLGNKVLKEYSHEISIPLFAH